MCARYQQFSSWEPSRHWMRVSERAAQISMPHQTQFGSRAIKDGQSQNAKRPPFYLALAGHSPRQILLGIPHCVRVLRPRNIITCTPEAAESSISCAGGRWRNKPTERESTLAATTYFFFWMTHADTSLGTKRHWPIVGIDPVGQPGELKNCFMAPGVGKLLNYGSDRCITLRRCVMKFIFVGAFGIQGRRSTNYVINLSVAYQL